eukprot:GHVH01014070.1.p1 GENE.GHVH01014070.1~~GHVH01014070.1.p1  ORF type:complete len:102 (+),score=2.66 GHVH01014070.1:480-785(+)
MFSGSVSSGHRVSNLRKGSSSVGSLGRGGKQAVSRVGERRTQAHVCARGIYQGARGIYQGLEMRKELQGVFQTKDATVGERLTDEDCSLDGGRRGRQMEWG